MDFPTRTPQFQKATPGTSDDSSLPPNVIDLGSSSDNDCKNEPQDKDSWLYCNPEVIAGLPIWSEFMFSYDLKDGILALYSKR